MNVHTEIMEAFLKVENRKNLSHKEKYGKCGTRGSKNNFTPFQDGFYNCIPSKVPEGYNSALGYCTETVMAAQRKQESKYL